MSKSSFVNKCLINGFGAKKLSFAMPFKRIVCVAAALAAAVSAVSCSFSGGVPIGTADSASDTTTSQQSQQSEYNGQPSVQTEIITGTSPQIGELDASDVELSPSAEYFLRDADESVRQCYREIYSGIAQYSENIDITDGVISSQQLDAFMSLVICTSPELNQLDSSYSIVVGGDNYVRSLNVSYVKSREEGDSQLAQLRAEVESIYLQAEGLDNYEKLKYFHDMIILKCAYSDETENAHSAYGCLIEGRAVCEGYSKAMLMLCSRAGILCIPVLGESYDTYGEVVPHMWNMVYLNGNWYNIDTTWDDPISNLGNDYVRYDYFNITDEVCSRDHTAEQSEFMTYPQATSDEENYYVKSGLVAYDINSAYEVFESAAINAVENNDRYVRVKCSTDEVYDWVYNEIFGGGTGNGRIFDILNSASERNAMDISAVSYSLIRNDIANTYTVILNR